MGDFPAPGPALDGPHHLPQEGVPVEGSGCRQPQAAVEPTEQSLSLGVGVVVHFQVGLTVGTGLADLFEPFLQTLALAGGNRQHPAGGKGLLQALTKPLQTLRAKQIDFVDDDEVGFLQLLAVDVNHLGRERLPGFQPQNSQGANRVHHHAQGGNPVILAIHAPQRIIHGGFQVGAASHRLGQKDIGPPVSGQTFGGSNQGIELAAEATARDLLHRKPAGAEHGGIDQPVALVVGNQSHLQPALAQKVGQLEHRRGLAGPQKPADHDVAGLIHDCPCFPAVLSFCRW